MIKDADNNNVLRTIDSFATNQNGAGSWNCGACGFNTTSSFNEGHLLSNLDATSVKVTVTCTEGILALLALAVVPVAD